MILYFRFFYACVFAKLPDRYKSIFPLSLIFRGLIAGFYGPFLLYALSGIPNFLKDN